MSEEMQEPKRRKEDDLGFISKHWIVLTTIAGCLVAYATLSANVNNMDKRLCVTEQKTEQVANISSDVEWIKKSLERIESKIK